MSLAFKTAYEAAEAIQPALCSARARRGLPEDDPAAAHRVVGQSRAGDGAASAWAGSTRSLIPEEEIGDEGAPDRCNAT